MKEILTAPVKSEEKSSLSVLGSLIKGQELQAQINKMVYESITESTEQAKQELKEYTDRSIEEIKKFIPLTDGEANRLKQAITSRAAVTTKSWLKHKFNNPEYGGKEFFSKKYGHIVRAFYSLTKHHFGAIKYTAILHSDFEEALGYANQLNYYSLPQNAKRITESQLVTLNKWEKVHDLPLTEPKE